MDIEFHYYWTYLIAARAGFPFPEAATIATASQFVDDNNFKVRVIRPHGPAYRSRVSQTWNILQPRKRLFKVYSVFHFIPGVPDAPSARRADGRTHHRNTTPDSPNARAILEEALKGPGRNLYRIGIACHGYADTWAHQNFAGYRTTFNAFQGVPLPNIGHADALHKPDGVGVSWSDRRLAGDMIPIDNTARFLDAACHLFRALTGPPPWSEAPAPDGAEEAALYSDLNRAVEQNGTQAGRLAAYRAMAEDPTGKNGKAALPEYDRWSWMEEAFTESMDRFRDPVSARSNRMPQERTFSWKRDDPACYGKRHWFRFQEAVKAHQAFVLGIL